MLWLTLSFGLVWLVAGLFFTFERANRMFLEIRTDRDSFGFTIGPALMLYLIGLIAYSIS